MSAGMRRWLGLRLRNAKIPADLARQMIVDFAVTRDGATLVLRGVVPPRMIATFPDERTAMLREMPQQVAAFHTAIVNSS